MNEFFYGFKVTEDNSVKELKLPTRVYKLLKGERRKIYRAVFRDFTATLLAKVIFGAIWAFPLKWTWNYAIPYIFGLPEINWLMAFSLFFVLSSLWKVSISTVRID